MSIDELIRYAALIELLIMLLFLAVIVNIRSILNDIKNKQGTLSDQLSDLIATIASLEGGGWKSEGRKEVTPPAGQPLASDWLREKEEGKSNK